MARNYIKKFTSKKTNYKNFKLPSGNKPGTPQSMAVFPNGSVVVVHNKSNANKVAYLRKYTQNGYVSNSQVANNNLGHCNGATYCDKNGLIYCTGYTGGSNTGKIVAMDTNFKQKFSFNLPVGVAGIAYDKTVNKFYCTRGNNIYVFPFSAFQKSNRTRSYKHFTGFSGTSQDVGGYNGIIYSVMWHESYGDIDLYKHTSGKYIGSIKISYSETESCGFDNNGNFIYMTANAYRALHWTLWKPQYKDGNVSAPKPANVTGSSATAFVAKAQSQVGTKEKGNNNVKYNTWYYKRTVSGDDFAWCAVFVLWCAHEVFGDKYTNIFVRNGLAHEVQQGVVTKGGQWVLKGSFAKNASSAAKCKAGDIITFDWNANGTADHVGIVKKVDGRKIYTIEGNHNDKVDAVTRDIKEVFRVARPKWPGGSYTVEGSVEGEYAEGEEGGAVFKASPEQLYSSANYHYIEKQEQEETEEQRKSKERQQALKEYLLNLKVEENEPAISDIALADIHSVSNYKKTRTKISGYRSGSPLPSTINYVEAPYVKIELGGVSIGTYKGGNYPNYINGINVRKTNGSMNEYTINLVHQISAGDNPNYIDNLISANGYNKIKIEYGDAEAGISYRDVEALLIDVKSSFDFFNNNINYTLYATSSSVMSAVNRMNYPSVTDKPSNIINNMLYDTGELLQYFPGMKNKSFVNSNNLIPSNDQKVSLNAVSNTTPLNYMNMLVSSMKSNISDHGNDYTYYLTIDDGGKDGAYFKIEQVKTKLTSSMFPLIYEVNINYPDEESLAYNFSVDTDYAWPLAYEYAGSFPTYSYDVNNIGNITKQKFSSNLKTTQNTLNSFISDQNWWTNVTEFPIRATLEVKGLTSYILLLNYIKVNVLYFGNKRNSSGIYIVTGQEDSLSGNGFRTKLELLKVAGDNQFITVDGRVVS